MKLGVVILAAGQGTRMKSSIPKVLHQIGGKPLLRHVVDVAKGLKPQKIIVVYGYGSEEVKARLNDEQLDWVLQDKQLGTGHAVQQAIPYLDGLDKVLVLYGDIPLIQLKTLEQLVRVSTDRALGLLTVKLDDPTGYGRILRDEYDRIYQIVEEKDADEDQRRIKEINVGTMLIEQPFLTTWLEKLGNDNNQGEYYLPDIVKMAIEDGQSISSIQPQQASEVEGVNDRIQLEKLERVYQRQQAEQLMDQGVTLRDASRFDLRGQLEVAADVSIDVNVIIEGRVNLGANTEIGANCIIKNSKLGADVKVMPNSIIEDAVIDDKCSIGPFARIRPGVELEKGVKIGNFVEIKQAHIGVDSKVNHLSYIGDTEIGARVNIGAGTITCNYDGANKNKTIIGDDVFVGSDTQLVAPVTVESGATIGAGSTITKDTPADELTLSRSRQITIKGWTRPKKAKN